MYVASTGELSMSLLQQLLSPWLHHLYLEGQPGLDDAWLPVVARATHLRALDLSASNLVSIRHFALHCQHLQTSKASIATYQHFQT
jgi:hypothetical protein